MLATTAFETLSRSVADSLGIPAARIAVVSHPLGGTDAATVRRWADAAVDEVIALLCRRAN